MSSCSTCGIPDDGSGRGRKIIITVKPENGFQRTRKTEVWVCCNECGVQALGISKYGAASHKWPIPLAKFRTMNPLPGV